MSRGIRRVREARSGEHGGTEGAGLEYEKATAWEPQLVEEVWDEVAVRGLFLVRRATGWDR